MQCIRRTLDVFNRECFIEIACRPVALAQQCGNGLVIFVAAANRLFEDRRIGCHPANSVAVHERLEFAIGDEPACEEIEPDGLAVGRKSFNWVHAVSGDCCGEAVVGCRSYA